MKVYFDVITNHTADVVDYKEKSYGYLSKGAFPYLTKDGRPFDDAGHADGTNGFPATDADSFPRTPVVPAAKKDSRSPPGSTTRRCTTTAVTPRTPAIHDIRRLLRARRPVDRASRGGRGHGEDLRAVGAGLRCRRLPHRHREAREHGVLDAVGDGTRPVCRRARTQELLHVRRGLFLRPVGHGPVRHPGRLDATLDFPFQEAARQYASQGGSAQKLAASSRTTIATRPTRPTPTSRSPSSATTTWGGSAPSWSRTTPRRRTRNCSARTASPMS